MRSADLNWAPATLERGALNAITDVPGVLVGHHTLISGDGPLIPGHGPIRTGVTAIIPRPGIYRHPVRASAHIINGYGKATGLSQLIELGQLETPVLLTGTLNVFRAADALCDYMIQHNPSIGIDSPTVNPVVLECSDAYLNDIQGRHVTREHVLSALDSAVSGPVAEGSVGAGTGMIAFGFKGGIGTSSRVVDDDSPYTVGVLVLANYGRRRDLQIRGVNVGQRLTDDDAGLLRGSVIVIAATEAPLTERQLGRLCRRAVVGLARTGGHIDHGSGEFVVAWTVSDTIGGLDDDGKTFSRLCRGTAEAVEESVLNALVAAQTMTGRDGHICPGLPVSRVCDLIGR